MKRSAQLLLPTRPRAGLLSADDKPEPPMPQAEQPEIVIRIMQPREARLLDLFDPLCPNLPGQITLLAKSGGSVVGYAAYVCMPPLASIISVVYPPYGSGEIVAMRLLEKVEEQVPYHHCTKVRWAVPEEDLEKQLLLRSRNYRCIRILPSEQLQMPDGVTLVQWSLCYYSFERIL